MEGFESSSSDEDRTPSRSYSSTFKSSRGKKDVDDADLLANVTKALASQNAKNNLDADSSFDISQDKSMRKLK